MKVKKSRILFLTQLPPPVHGSSVMNNHLAKSNQIRNEFELTVIDISLDKKIENIGAFTLIKLWSYLKINIKTIYHLLTKRYACAYMSIATAGFPFYKDSLLVLWLKIFRTRTIFHLHGKGIDDVISISPLKRTFYNWIYKNTFVIHLSESLYTDISLITSIKEKYVLHNGVPSINKKETKNRTPQILYLSNFFESKGALKLLEVARLLNEEGLAFNLKLIGGWPEKDFKDQLLKFHNSVNWRGEVEILGPLQGKLKEEIMQLSDILVFPSMYKLECFPLVILEAMSCGLCVVASREGAIPEIFEEGISGILIDPQDIPGFTNELKLLLLNMDKVYELGDKASQVYEQKYTMTQFEKKWISIITNIIKDD